MRFTSFLHHGEPRDELLFNQRKCEDTEKLSQLLRPFGLALAGLSGGNQAYRGGTEGALKLYGLHNTKATLEGGADYGVDMDMKCGQDKAALGQIRRVARTFDSVQNGGMRQRLNEFPKL